MDAQPIRLPKGTSGASRVEPGNATLLGNAELFYSVERESREVLAPGERTPVWVANGVADRLGRSGPVVSCVPRVPA